MSSILTYAPETADVLLTLPSPHVLLVSLNRPAQLNSLRSWQHQQLARLWDWFDAEPSLRCAVITGTGRAFCAGADLKEWNGRTGGDTRGRGVHNAGPDVIPERWNSEGFGGLSNRTGKKPIIAAVNGLCLGGGMEMIINCDLVVAGEHRVKFSLPEVKRGVIALAGALPRLMRTLGKQRASEMALLGRMYGSKEMQQWGLVNFVVEDDGVGRELAPLQEALMVASEIARNSPDSIIVSREGLRLGWEPMGPVSSTAVLGRGLYGRMNGEENMKEGLASFAEKRSPTWRDSKL